MDPFRYQRQRMVREALMDRGISDPRVLEQMETVPRHLFVPEHLRSQAYGDHALPIQAGQTISQPWVVARMTELLEVESKHRVLEIGTGSGYQTAILAGLAQWVFSLERIGELSRSALKLLKSQGIENVKLQIFDGSVGWSDMGPFDRIMVTAGAPKVPKPLLDQLAKGGRLLIPEGPRERQELVLYTRREDGAVFRQEAEAVVFVPLVGRYGYASPTN